APGSVELVGILRTGESDRIHRIDEANSRATVFRRGDRSPLAIALRATQIQVCGAGRHAVQVDGVG
ncbi:MAG: hypothetical protein VYE68_01110, partial [Acidobacteriota bacterium]|nr:hypothetical protein [Acidobacteriota bacterium]